MAVSEYRAFVICCCFVVVVIAAAASLIEGAIT